MEPFIKTRLAPSYACMYITNPTAQQKTAKEATKGQGLGSTRWNGCLWTDFETFTRGVIF